MDFLNWLGQGLTVSKNALTTLGSAAATHYAQMLHGFSRLYAPVDLEKRPTTSSLSRDVLRLCRVVRSWLRCL